MNWKAYSEYSSFEESWASGGPDKPGFRQLLSALAQKTNGKFCYGPHTVPVYVRVRAAIKGLIYLHYEGH